MWIIIPGQRLDEQETLTHNTLMQPAETGGRQGWCSVHDHCKAFYLNLKNDWPPK